MSTHFPFTHDRLEALTCPPSGRPRKDGKRWVYDAKTTGLAFCVTEGGARAFYWCRRIPAKVPGKVTLRRKRIGDFPEYNVDKARKQASRWNDRLAVGVDPIAEIEAATVAAKAEAAKESPTMGALWASYRDHWLANKRDRTVKEFARLYAAHLEAWDDRPLAEITSADLETLKTRIGTDSKYTANRVLELVSAMFRRRGHTFGLPRGFTPTDGVDAYPEKARERVLSDDELVKVLDAVEADENWVARDYLKMLLYTGQRRRSVARMAWANINQNDLDGSATWTLPGETTKNGAPLVVALHDEAIKILKYRHEHNPPDSPWVFPSKHVTPEQVSTVRELRQHGLSTHKIAREVNLSQSAVVAVLAPGYTPRAPGPFDGATRAWQRVLKRAGITQRTTLHDLRRTFCTRLLDGDVALPKVSAAMGHRSMQTTFKHYAFTSNKAVADATRGMVTDLLANVAKLRAQAELKSKPKKGKGAA